MKKQNLVNLIKYHIEKNEEAFVAEVAEIAKDFDAKGDSSVAQYLMELISNTNFYIPQISYRNLKYLTKMEYSLVPGRDLHRLGPAQRDLLSSRPRRPTRRGGRRRGGTQRLHERFGRHPRKEARGGHPAALT